MVACPVAETHDALTAAERYAEQFHAADLPAPPARRLAVLTCMDARIEPLRLLGLDLGDAHVIRNAGGRASDDALRSLIVSSQLLGTNDLLVIHHTQCGMEGLDEDELRKQLSVEAGHDAGNIDFLSFTALEESVREDMDRIKECPFIPVDATVRGFIYDVRSGGLTEVTRQS